MLAPTPPMGFNTWNTFGAEISDELVRTSADAMVETGLLEAGYDYLVIDDLWEADSRQQGRLTWDADKFPHGIKPVADYVHERGLKFGIYSCAGHFTCAGKPGSYGYEEADAQAFAEWGVDFLKYDYCYKPIGMDGPMLYRRMGQALRATRRPIVFSLCEWGANEPWTWGAGVGAHMWRTTGDIFDRWDSILDIGFDRQAELHPFAGPDHWNDPDMLVVGMYGDGNVARGGCTDSEYRVHFVHWCMLAAPLMIGCDVRRMNDFTRGLLTHQALLSINQDPAGRQAYRVGVDSPAGSRMEVWAKPLEDGCVAVALYNLGPADGAPQRATVPWAMLGLPEGRLCRVSDVMTGEPLGEFQVAFTSVVEPHDVRVVKLAPLM